MAQSEIVFTVHESPADGYEARALGYSIFTQADSMEELPHASHLSPQKLRTSPHKSRHTNSLVPKR